MTISGSYSYTVVERFLRYAAIDTQSNPDSPSCPSTNQQKELGRLLVKELNETGLHDAEMDDRGYVYATLPSNSPKAVPVICFCSHMDTAPDFSGKNVKAIVHKNYQGGRIQLPGDPLRIITPEEHPALKNQVGNDIITSDGTTLLGADNKAGIAEIIDAMHYLVSHPQVKHGAIRLLFTPDEEIGRGVDFVDMNKLNAAFGYTVDGETAGQIEDETFSANGLNVFVKGVASHPGFARNKMENAIKIAGEILAALPREFSPEGTEGREGFVHPVACHGMIEQAEIKFIIRDFETIQLGILEQRVKKLATDIIKKYPGSTVRFETIEQYRNMKEILSQHSQVTQYALEAVQRAGIKPQLGYIRGGTDGSRLSFMGLPCPNIFTGGHAFHSPLEWISVQDMKRAVQTLVHLAVIWEEKS